MPKSISEIRVWDKVLACILGPTGPVFRLLSYTRIVGRYITMDHMYPFMRHLS
jgi:hypothetical protein